MAATDQTYRSQRTLDLVFGVSSLLMLVSIVLMFAQDYFRPWKTEQCAFLKTESVMAEREALHDVAIMADRYDAAMYKVVTQLNEHSNNKQKIKDLDDDIKSLTPKKEKQDKVTANVKADLASRESFYNIAVETHGPGGTEARLLWDEVVQLRKKLADEQDTADRLTEEIQRKTRQRNELESGLARARTELTEVTGDLLRKVRTALKKQWGWGDWFRSLPILDAFASPTKIDQITLNELTIDYNFKGVTRFDRCMTCHKGIDRVAYTREKLLAARSARGPENPPGTPEADSA